MVMVNRQDETGWWDDLPPRIRSRFERVEPESHREPSVAEASEVAPPPSNHWLRDSSLLAGMFLLVAMANVLLLLFVLAYVDGVAAPIPWQNR